MIWEPFILALVLGIIVSAGLYFAYLWPSVEPADDEPATVSPQSPAEPPPSVATEAGAEVDAATEADAAAGAGATAGTDDAAGADATAGTAP